MATANFVVITNGGGGVRAYWNSRYQPIACHVLSFRELRLVVLLGGVIIGGYMI